MLRHSSGCLREKKKKGKKAPGLSHLLPVRNMFGSKFPGKQGKKKKGGLFPNKKWSPSLSGFCLMNLWMRNTEQQNKVCI